MNEKELIKDLLHQVGKVALEMGEEWRLKNPELMDAYEELLCLISTEEYE